MKTTALENTKIKNGILSLVLTSAVTVLLAGCQKEDQATIKSGDDQNSQERIRARNTTYTMFVFDHAATRTNLPDYTIEINTDGTVVFLGRRNTAFIGTKILYVSQETIGRLKNLFIENKFNEIKDDLVLTPDLPLVSTSFRMDLNSESITLIDDNLNYPARLIDIRKKAEEILDITTLIKTKRNMEYEPVLIHQAHD